MPDPPASPGAARLATPSWLDARLVLGVLLVLVSVVVGARLLSRADDRQSVWVLTRDLAAGSTLAEGDLQPGQVRLFDTGARYVLAGTGGTAGTAKPVGYVLQRAVGKGELLPRGSLVRPDGQAPALRDVSVPVAVGHLPEDLQPGQQVDVYATAGDRPAGTAPAPARTSSATGTGATASDGSGTALVLSRLTVTLRPRGATGATQSVVLSVPVTDVPRLVAAGQAGGVDLVRVARGDERPTLPAVAPAAATR